MDCFALIIDFGRKKDKISNEWMIQLYFVSLRSESEVKKIVELLHGVKKIVELLQGNVVYKIILFFI